MKTQLITGIFLFAAIAISNSANAQHHKHDRSTYRRTTTYSPGYTYVKPQCNTTVYYSPQRNDSYYNRNNRGHQNNHNACNQGIRVLPHNTRMVTINHNTYYRDGNTFYIYRRGFYQVVPPPINARIASLPHHTVSVWRLGRHYYQYDNVLLEAFVGKRGVVRYRVIGYA